MAAAVKLRTDYSASDLRRLAAASKHANQSQRLLSLAAVLDGMDREQAARIGGMDRQTLRDWVHRFNALGPDGLRDIRSKPNGATRALFSRSAPALGWEAFHLAETLLTQPLMVVVGDKAGGFGAYRVVLVPSSGFSEGQS